MKNIVSLLCIFFLAGLSRASALLEVSANPDKGFRYPYLLKIPDTITTQSKTFLIVETNNTGKVSDDYNVHLEAARHAVVGNSVGPWLSKALAYPILMPVFPRGETEWQVYTHALDRDSMLAKSVPFERLDLQLKAMIEHAHDVLRDRSITVQDKIILAGFSASGTFANRFSMIHPEIIEIVVAGGLNGTLMMPALVLDGYSLDYPLGVNDFSQIANKPFNLNEWLRIKQFLFMGENDINDAVAYDDAYSEDERFIVHKTMGKFIHPERWEKSQEVYKRCGARVTFRTFKGVGHGTNGNIHSELLTFVKGSI